MACSETHTGMHIWAGTHNTRTFTHYTRMQTHRAYLGTQKCMHAYRHTHGSPSSPQLPGLTRWVWGLWLWAARSLWGPGRPPMEKVSARLPAGTRPGGGLSPVTTSTTVPLTVIISSCHARALKTVFSFSWVNHITRAQSSPCTVHGVQHAPRACGHHLRGKPAPTNRHLPLPVGLRPCASTPPERPRGPARRPLSASH